MNLICLDDRKFQNQIEEEFSAVRIMVSQPDGNWRSLWRLSANDFAAVESLDAAMKLIGDALAVLPPQQREYCLLTIPPFDTQGFAIEVMLCQDSVRAWFGGLEEEFATLDDALSWVARALSGDYELRTVVAGGLGREWKLVHVDGDDRGFASLASGQLTLWPFRKREVVVRRNALAWRMRPATSTGVADAVADATGVPAG
jgi:hypothetical protein